VLLDFHPSHESSRTTTQHGHTQTNWYSVEPNLVRFVKLQRRSSFTRSPLLQVSPAGWAQSIHLIATSSIFKQNLLLPPPPGEKILVVLDVSINFIHKAQLCNLVLTVYFPNDEMRLYCYDKNSVAWVRERTIPTERTPLVGEVSVNFCGQRVPHGKRVGSLRPYSRISRPKPLLFLPSSSSTVLTRLSGSRFRQTIQKIW
jgi:hypothetical protein